MCIIRFMALGAKKHRDFEYAKRCSLEFMCEWRQFQPSSSLRLGAVAVLVFKMTFLAKRVELAT